LCHNIKSCLRDGVGRHAFGRTAASATFWMRLYFLWIAQRFVAHDKRLDNDAGRRLIVPSGPIDYPLTRSLAHARKPTSVRVIRQLHYLCLLWQLDHPDSNPSLAASTGSSAATTKTVQPGYHSERSWRAHSPTPRLASPPLNLAIVRHIVFNILKKDRLQATNNMHLHEYVAANDWDAALHDTCGSDK
jgi:hypothetical protein